MTDEIEIGPFLFELDRKTNEVFVSMDGDHVATIEHVWPERWAMLEDHRRRFDSLGTHDHAGLPFH